MIPRKLLCISIVLLILFARSLKAGDTGLVCAVDMGSNTFKFIIAEIKGGKYVQYLDERKTAGVGDDLEASEKKSGRKVISEKKIQEIHSLLADFQDQCQQKTRSSKILGIATAAVREAENGKVLAAQLAEKGIDVQILDAEQESIYAYESATLGEPDLAVIDLGSRTTEFVNRKGDKYQWTELHTGYKVAWDEFYAATFTFGNASSQHLSKLKTLIQDKDIQILQNQRELVGIEMGETSSYVLGIPNDRIEGKVLTKAQVQNKLTELQNLDEKAFADLKRNFSDAAKVLPRLVLLNLVLEQSGYEKIRVTNRELNVAIVYKKSVTRTSRPQ